MLAFPISTTETSEDGKRVVIRPAGWTFLTAANMLKLAVELQFAALTAMGKDPAEMDDAEAGAIAEAGP